MSNEHKQKHACCNDSLQHYVPHLYLSLTSSLLFPHPSSPHSPFFAEEFHFEIPRRFCNLAFYVYDHDSSRDKVLGKVALKREDLHIYHGKDHWLPIKAVDEDSEVEGKIHVGVKIDHVLSSRTGQTVEKLAVR
jgi:hypothetical protein